MNSKTRFLIVLTSMLIGLFSGFFLFGSLTHENSHAFMCMLFGAPYKYSLSQITYNSANVSPMANTIIRVSGGIGQTLLALTFLWLATIVEKRNTNWVFIFYRI